KDKTDTLPSSVKYALSIPSLSLNNFQWHDAYAHRRIYGGDLILDAPRVFIETYQDDEKTGFTLPQTYPFNPQQLASVSLKSLGVQNANINLVLQHDTRRMPYTLDST